MFTVQVCFPFVIVVYVFNCVLLVLPVYHPFHPWVGVDCIWVNE